MCSSKSTVIFKNLQLDQPRSYLYYYSCQRDRWFLIMASKKTRIVEKNFVNESAKSQRPLIRHCQKNNWFSNSAVRETVDSCWNLENTAKKSISGLKCTTGLEGVNKKYNQLISFYCSLKEFFPMFVSKVEMTLIFNITSKVNFIQIGTFEGRIILFAGNKKCIGIKESVSREWDGVGQLQ
jgi:hypothetical protein